MNDSLKVILKGLAVGGSMTVPGISGGSMAMIAGIYDRLVESVSRVFSEPKRQFPFLLKFAAGAAAGIILLAGVISWVLDTPAGLPMRFAFLGAVAGGIPMIVKQTGLKKLKVPHLLLILTGALAVVLLGLLPDGIFSPANEGAGAFAARLCGGFLTAAALVLPGISASHMMYMLGIYEQIMDSVSNLDIPALLPFAFGVIIGTFLTAKLLEKLFSKHKTGVWLIILGFMAGSLHELIPQNADGIQLILGVFCALTGFAIVYVITKKAPSSALNGQDSALT